MIFTEDDNYAHLTELIIGSCFEVMNELGCGFLEIVYKNALIVALQDKGIKVEFEKRFGVVFRGRTIGIFVADLVVEGKVILELKSCESLHGEHQAQLINYLTVSNIPVGLLVNFGKRKLEYRRLCHPILQNSFVHNLKEGNKISRK